MTGEVKAFLQRLGAVAGLLGAALASPSLAQPVDAAPVVVAERAFAADGLDHGGRRLLPRNGRPTMR